MVWDTTCKNSLLSSPVECPGSHPRRGTPLLAFYCEASCGVPAGVVHKAVPRETAYRKVAMGHLVPRKKLCAVQEPEKSGPLEPGKEAPSSHSVSSGP